MGFVFLDRKVVAMLAAVGVTVLIAGILIGYFAAGSNDNPDNPVSMGSTATDPFQDEIEMVEKAVRQVDREKLREYLQYLTKEPHLAALRRDKELTNWIKDTWEEFGFDKVELAEYNMYLSWPNQTNPNKIFLLDGEGQVRFTSQHKEKDLREEDYHEEFVHAFNGYSPAGDVSGQMVYVNYGDLVDFDLLETLGISVENKICIARYGKIFRGNKVKNCADRGGIGIVLYTDPAEVAVEGTDKEKVYPQSFFLPGTGIQRGTTFIGDGDPLSPDWASIDNAYRENPENVHGLPKIPAQPIGYDDATELLSKLGGQDAPEEWKGKIDGLTYKIGGEFKPEFRDWKVRIKTNNFFGDVKSSNVIGYITGSVEPDRYVFLSNHRDAWGYGSVDPSSGTAQLMEVARVLGYLRSEFNWQPRRTIVLASWAAEEYGLLGSYEWVYDKRDKLMARSVGLVNTDICVSGPIAKPQASPFLRDIVVEAFKMADDPLPPNHKDHKDSYYDYWYDWWNQDADVKSDPKVSLLGSGSDHAPFAFYAGIPSVNLRFKDDTKKHKGVGQYPTYHTGYETFYLVDSIIDNGFYTHRSCAQSSLHMLLKLADSKILPYNLHHLPKEMETAFDSFQERNITKTLSDNGITLDYLKNAVSELSQVINKFMSYLEDQRGELNPLKMRMLNDQLMQLERVFVIPAGLPDRVETRHAIFAPPQHDKYGSSAFPGIPDLVYGIDKLSDGEKEERVKVLKRHVSDLMIMVKNAADFLTPIEDI